MNNLKLNIKNTIEDVKLDLNNNPEKIEDGALAIGTGLLTTLLIVKKTPLIIGGILGGLVGVTLYKSLEKKLDINPIALLSGKYEEILISKIR